jgi:hypothetical protein
MSHPDDYQYYLDCGCEDMSHSLGFQNMPDGYSLVLNADQSHFFWMERATGVESAIHWSKWSCYRGAKEHAAATSAPNSGESSDEWTA